MLFVYMAKKSIQISWARKKLSRWNKKHFLLFSKGLSLKQIKHFLLEGESPTLAYTYEGGTVLGVDQLHKNSFKFSVYFFFSF